MKQVIESLIASDPIKRAKPITMYKRIHVPKQFPRWDCNQFEDEPYCSSDFTEKFDRLEQSIKPTFNPLNKAEFDSNTKIYDIYNLREILSVRRGFLVSGKFKSILDNFNICKHVLYEDISYTHKGLNKSDMNFIFFYYDLTNHVDFNKTKFCTARRDKLFEWGGLDIEEKKEFFVENEIYVNSYEEYLQLGREYSSMYDLLLEPYKIYIKSDKPLDIISGNSQLVSSIYFSDKLISKLETERISGCEFTEVQHVKIICE